MVVRDDASLGATNTFAAEQGVGGEAVEDLDKDIIHEASQCVPLIRGLLHFLMCMQSDESLLSDEITEEKNNPTKIHQ